MGPTDSGREEAPRLRPASRARWWPAGLFLGISFLFFWQYFLLDLTLYGGDQAFVFLPLRRYLVERLGRGELPLWNPHLFGGTPALAEAQNQVFYLPNLLLFLTGVPRGMGWTLPLHLAFMAAGTYLFARRGPDLERAPAAAAALVFAFGGCVQSHLANSPYPQAAAWLPWVLLGYDTARARGGAAFLLPGTALACQLFTGAPQFTYYTLALLGAYHLFRLREEGGGPARRAWGALAATLGLGGLLAAVQVLPELELALHSDRGARASYAFATEFSLAPHHFAATLLFPKFWGSFNTAPLDGFYPGEEQGYLGALTLGLAAAALAAARPRRAVLFWLGVALVSVLLALGGNNPLYPLLYRWVPGIAAFRAPARWLLVTSFAGAVLAGFGLQALLGEAARARLAARAGAGLLAAGALGGAGLLLTPWGAPALATPQAPYGAWGQVALLALCAALIGALALLQGSVLDSLRNRAPALAILLLVADLFAVSLDMEIRHTLLASSLETPPESIAALRDASPPERFWANATPVILEKWQNPEVPAWVPAQELRADNATHIRVLMPSCMASEFGAWGLNGVWGALMPLRRHARPVYQAEARWPERRRWLRLLNVRYYISLDPIGEPGFERFPGGPPFLARDPQALPRAFVVGKALEVARDAALPAAGSPGFDPRREVVLESLPGDSAAPPGGASFAPAGLVDYRPERVVLEADAGPGGYLVLMDTCYPGWRARVDGRPAPVRPANWVGRAVPLPPGRHRVEMTFEPGSFRTGLFVSLVTLAGMAGVLVFGRRRRAR